jgi:hypothetical protein
MSHENVAKFKYLQKTVAYGKNLTIGGTSATLPKEVTLNHNYPR